jgi:serine/threonine protein kinase
VALRILAPRLSEDREFVERFRRQRWPEHPHIVPVYEAGECEHGLFLAMQLVRGQTLAEMLEHGAFAQPSRLAVLTQMAGALDASHEDGLAHGWLRPEAVLVEDSGWAWLSDFGLSPGAGTCSSDRVAFAKLTRTCLGKRTMAKGQWETLSALIAATTAKYHRAPGENERSGWRRHARG